MSRGAKLTTEDWMFDISPHHGIERDTVTFMLSCWVMALARYDDWIADDEASDLHYKYNLDADDIERVSNVILNALDGSGISRRLAGRHGFLVSADCQINKDLVFLRLIWESL